VLTVMLGLFSTFILNETFPVEGLSAGIKSVSDVLLPILVNAGFLPIVSYILELFICTESTGDDIYDAFLYKDCYVTCWELKHLSWIITSSLLLILYIPMCIYMRPRWQEYQYDLNILTLPTYLVVKACF
jgi:hypothetical protein